MIYHSGPWLTQAVLAFNRDIEDPENCTAAEKGARVTAASPERAAFFALGSAVFINMAGVLWTVSLTATVITAFTSLDIPPIVAIVLSITACFTGIVSLRLHQRQKLSVEGEVVSFKQKDLIISALIAVVCGGLWGLSSSEFCRFAATLPSNLDPTGFLGFIGIGLLILTAVAYGIGDSASVDATYPYYRKWRIDEEDAPGWFSAWRKVYFVCFTLWFAYLLLIGRLTQLDVSTVVFWLCCIPMLVLVIKAVRDRTLPSSTRLGQSERLYFWIFELPRAVLVVILALKLFFFWVNV